MASHFSQMLHELIAKRRHSLGEGDGNQTVNTDISPLGELEYLYSESWDEGSVPRGPLFTPEQEELTPLPCPPLATPPAGENAPTPGPTPECVHQIGNWEIHVINSQLKIFKPPPQMVCC